MVKQTLSFTFFAPLMMEALKDFVVINYIYITIEVGVTNFVNSWWAPV